MKKRLLTWKDVFEDLVQSAFKLDFFLKAFEALRVLTEIVPDRSGYLELRLKIYSFKIKSSAQFEILSSFLSIFSPFFRKRLLISSCFFSHAYTSLIYEVYACKKACAYKQAFVVNEPNPPRQRRLL